MVGGRMRTEDGATREEIEEALGHFSNAAKGVPQAVGNSTWKSPWDRLHESINTLLDQLDEYRLEAY